MVATTMVEESLIVGVRPQARVDIQSVVILAFYPVTRR